MKYFISNQQKTISANINLPSSKSISNRILIINALSFNPYPVWNLSDSDDTRVLAEVLSSNKNKFDIGHAGTAMRFLTAFLSRIAGEWEITGSERMKQRPIGILVNALEQLGARIEYLGQKNFPPLRIFGSHLKGKTLYLDGSISSQYISALLMIGPTLENGLAINLQGEITSRSYIELTLKLMEHFGIRYQWENNTITLNEQQYLPGEYSVEADWSGASYWYQILAMAKEGKVFLENLRLDSLQGDASVAHWFRQFGIISTQQEKGVLLVKDLSVQPQMIILDFIENPDIAQTLACLCVAKKIPFHFTGLKTLKIKETDRIAALKKELMKFGAVLTEPAEGEMAWDGVIVTSKLNKIQIIKTYHDHRMALSFAPMALAGHKLAIDDPGVVTKSYPGYWNDLKKAGFEILISND